MAERGFCILYFLRWSSTRNPLFNFPLYLVELITFQFSNDK